MTSTSTLTDNVLKLAPDTAYYIPDFVSEREENIILENVYSAPKPKWTVLSNRRLQNWGGLPHPKGMIPEPFPQWLKNCIDKVNALGIFPENAHPNHVLINEYLPGQGIMPHQDGSYFWPIIATLNCGSHTVLNFYPLNSDSQESSKKSIACSLFLERRSLLVLRDSMYSSYMHGIKPITEDDLREDNIVNLEHCATSKGCNLVRDTRISLTIRNVPKCTKFKFRLTK